MRVVVVKRWKGSKEKGEVRGEAGRGAEEKEARGKERGEDHVSTVYVL